MKLRYVVLTLLLLLVASSLVVAFRQTPTPFATLDLGSGYTMRFFARPPDFFDDLPIDDYKYLDYELTRDDRILWRRGFGGTSTAPETFQFQVLTSSDRSIVAVVEAFAPDIVLDIRDLANGEGWPDQADHEDHNPVRERGHRLLARLQPSVSQQLILSTEFKGR